jgi:seryl-tRNA synthetase
VASQSKLEKAAKKALKAAEEAVAEARRAAKKVDKAARRKLKKKADGLAADIAKLQKKTAAAPAASEPTASKQVASKPVASKPDASAPDASKPAPSKPTASKPVSEVTPAPTASALESLTVADLRTRARAEDIHGYSSLNKADLIAALSDGGR